MKSVKLLIIFLLLGSSHSGWSYTFTEAIKGIDEHNSVSSLSNMASAMGEMANAKGSWGDPKLKLAAKNYPTNTLKDNETPMTGIEVGLAQKVSLTPKHGFLKDAMMAISDSKNMDVEQTKRKLRKVFWTLSIKLKQAKEDLEILKENLSWVKGMLRVSKKRYTNGKISQQALLDLQIRKSEIESMIINKEHFLKELNFGIVTLLFLLKKSKQATHPCQILKP